MLPVSGQVEDVPLYLFVLILSVGGLAAAAAAIIPLRAVSAIAPTVKLKRAWRWLTAAIVFCLVLRGTAAIVRLRFDLNASDVLDAIVHLIGPLFVLGVAWLSLKTTTAVARATSLEKLAFQDPLTGLGNRRSFDSHLADAIADAPISGRSLALIVIDVDHFKAVNDRFGHGTGDDALRRIATIVTGTLSVNDRAFRIGGDEFAIVCRNLTYSGYAGVAAMLCQRVGALETFHTGGISRTLTVSVGSAAFGSGDTLETLFKRADAALYEAKQAGRNTARLAA